MSMLTPHGACLEWQPVLVWINAVSDALIGAGFFATALFLGLLVWRRRDLQFAAAFLGFGAYVMVCGLTRLLSILTLWVPAYGIEAAAKSVQAVMSVGIAAALLLIVLPRLLVLPGRNQLQQAYAALEEEVRQRRKAEDMVKRFQELEATEVQVRQAQKMEAIGQLTGGVAHDFNNILTVITGSIEILSDAVKHRRDLAPIAKMITAAAARGADLTQHLLAFARRQPLQPRSTDVNAMVIDVARLLRPTLGEQIEIESRWRPGMSCSTRTTQP
jgi:signal transduction histidine kinase